MFKKLDFFFFGAIINWMYPEYYRPKYGYLRYYILFFHYLIPQKLFRLNPKVNWPVHFTSKVLAAENITKGILCDPGDNNNNYIQANNGIIFGSNIELGPGVSIISSNHKGNNLREHTKGKPITIGNNVIIGANSLVNKDITSNSVAVGNPCKVIKQKEPYTEDLSAIIFNKKIPKNFDIFLNSNV